jgi:glycogen phosphorylase
MVENESRSPVVAYFSMEIGLETAIPTYSGGLGVLAGDSLRSAADIGIPLVGVTLLYWKGYFRQHLDAYGNQTESPVEWDPAHFMQPLDSHIRVKIEGRDIAIRPWQYTLKSTKGKDVVIYFLDTNLPENTPWDRTLTDYLYGGDSHYRFCQEVILGLGGIAALRALGYLDVTAYHMNESHSSLLALALLEEEAKRSGKSVDHRDNVEEVREQCVFTTHTPIPAGIDVFPVSMVRQVLGSQIISLLSSINCIFGDSLNMIFLALFFSRYINGVSLRNEEISRDMYPSYPINSITNGVHALTWTSEPFYRLFDKHVPEWRHDNLYLRYAIRIPLDEVRESHRSAKLELVGWMKDRGFELDSSIMTLGFARRMTQYKRATLLFSNIDRLKQIAQKSGRLQIIMAGKAHPQDLPGKGMIRQLFHAADALKDVVKVVFLEEYDLTVAKLLCAGVDLWLNTPQMPYEASGTSGMKAALNGVPSLSILDGWWVEGWVEGVTGWSIGELTRESNPASEAASLYHKLENVIVPLFYQDQRGYGYVMRAAIALNGSYYNSQRMMFQYLEHAYMPPM